jgi:hypothetical protein
MSDSTASARKDLIRWFDLSMDRAVKDEPGAWTRGSRNCVFVGCPQVANLAHYALRKLGLDPVFMFGAVPAADGNSVHHIWVEVPDLGIRVETNPSQILGWPVFVYTMALDERAEIYSNAEVVDENFPAIGMTFTGVRFFDRLSDEVVRHYRKATKGRR